MPAAVVRDRDAAPPGSVRNVPDEIHPREVGCHLVQSGSVLGGAIGEMQELADKACSALVAETRRIAGSQIRDTLPSMLEELSVVEERRFAAVGGPARARLR